MRHEGAVFTLSEHTHTPSDQSEAVATEARVHPNTPVHTLRSGHWKTVESKNLGAIWTTWDHIPGKWAFKCGLGHIGRAQLALSAGLCQFSAPEMHKNLNVDCVFAALSLVSLCFAICFMYVSHNCCRNDPFDPKMPPPKKGKRSWQEWHGTHLKRLFTCRAGKWDPYPSETRSLFNEGKKKKKIEHLCKRSLISRGKSSADARGTF